MNSPLWMGVFEGHWDPSIALVQHGRVVAFMEEERLVRFKHAPRQYPIHAMKQCLDQIGAAPQDVKGLAINWNLPAFTDGTLAAFFSGMADQWPLDEGTRRWQRQQLGYFNLDATRQRHERHWKRAFGDVPLPELHHLPHHYVHALHAFMQSPFPSALCLTVDGSGDQHCTVLWACRGEEIRPIREILMPHSLGWFYAAFTEYLGFEAYDGEYKVMGLAAYGRPRPDLKAKVRQVLAEAPDGIEYRLDPSYIHYGEHTWSDRFTDDLVALFAMPRRLSGEPILPWHEDLAFAVQEALEEAVGRLVTWGMEATGLRTLCIGGGVGLNVKMNSRIFAMKGVEDFFAQPLCSDGGAAAGAALGVCWQQTGVRPEPLSTLALGGATPDEAIEHTLRLCKIPFERVEDIAQATAGELAAGRIVGWFQGRLEAGPRALGQRSILADPRQAAMRDRINEAIKFREYWRPFCPSLPAEDASRFLVRHTDAPFMNLAFDANEALKKLAPAVVHVDGTVRVQLVHREVLPLYHRLLRAFEARTGVPVLLNTSFNVKGEPIVASVSDALRTFSASGLDVLAMGNFLIKKGGWTCPG